MRRHLRRVFFVGAICAAILTGCAEPDAAIVAPTASVRVVPAVMRTQAKEMVTWDEELASLADSVPGFGGIEVGADNQVEIMLTASGALRERDGVAAMQRHARARGWDRGGVRFNQIRVRRAQFGIKALLDARRALDDIAIDSALGIRWTDVDEARNQVAIGVVSERDSARVTRFLLTRGLTAAGMRVALTPEISPNQTVRDNVQPLRGGMAIDAPGVPGAINCTIGPWIKYTAGPLPDIDVALTNSHCTNMVNGVPQQAPLVYQAGQFIGWETGDYPLSRYSGCPKNRWCRRAEVAIVTLDPNVWRLNTVVNLGAPHSITWPNTPGITDPPGLFPLSIVDQDTVWAWNDWNMPPGVQLRKTGMRTGTTTGTVLQTCLNIGPLSWLGGAVLTCQSKASYFILGGDSGSPVFTWVPSPPWLGGHIELVGINWGGEFTAAPGYQWISSYFSPSANIRAEFPNLYDP
jgi:hypothetical protein